MTRTDREIIEQTEAAAAKLAAADCFFLVSGTYRNSEDPRCQRYWAMACQMQDLLTNTDVYNALANLDEDRPGEWVECQRIADIPEVHELLQAFSNDPTGDNGAMVVREIRRAVIAAPDPVRDALLSFCQFADIRRRELGALSPEMEEVVAIADRALKGGRNG